MIARESGRACGCDPKNDYACEGHASYVDDSEVAVRAYVQDLQPLEIVICGPTENGNIGLFIDGRWHWVPRFEAEDLATEVLRRLAPRKG